MKSNYAENIKQIRGIVSNHKPFTGNVDDLAYWVKSTQDKLDQIKQIAGEVK